MKRINLLRLAMGLCTVAFGMNVVSRSATAQDAGSVIEPWDGVYNDVKIQWWDQKIVAAGLWYVPSN